MPLCYGESSLIISSWYISQLFLYDPSNSHLLPQNYFNKRCFFLLILIYFLCIPLHGLSFKYPLCLFPSCLNYAFVYFNQICATIHLVYPLHIKEHISLLYRTHFTQQSKTFCNSKPRFFVFPKIVDHNPN